MDRAFSDFENRFERSFLRPFGGNWFVPAWNTLKLPETRRAIADLIDAGNEYRVRVEVPGIPKEKLDISVTPTEIRIEGESLENIDEKKEGFLRRERAFTKVRRELNFPEEVVAGKAEASVKDGILEVRVPKKTPTEAKTHKIQVK
jgi:HSP20 family protein